MQIDPTHSAIVNIYEELKFWAPFAGVMWATFKAWQWIKELKTKDIADVNKGLASLNTKMDVQTSAVVDQLKEMRSDFRTFYQPPPRPARAAARKK